MVKIMGETIEKPPLSASHLLCENKYLILLVLPVNGFLPLDTSNTSTHEATRKPSDHARVGISRSAALLAQPVESLPWWGAMLG